MERITNADAPDGKRVIDVAEYRAGQNAFDAQCLKPLKLFDEINGKGCG
jgi:hypothetical protein